MKSITTVLAVVICLYSLSCKTRQQFHNIPTSNLRDDSTPISTTKVKISVRHQATSPAWQVTYKFSEPTDGFVFISNGIPTKRLNFWKVEGENGDEVTFDSNGNDGVIGKNGHPFTEFTASFDLKTEFLEAKDSDYSQRLSDGSVALQTFLFLSGYQLKNPQNWQFFKVVPTYKFTPAPAEFVTAGLKTSESEVEFSDSPRSMGVYVYFGKIKPESRTPLSFTVDPGVSAEVKEMVMSTAAKTFSLYTKQFGELPFVPSIFVIKNGELSPNSASGNAMWGQFLVTIFGSGVNIQDFEREIITNAVTHEMSHFWNALLYQARWQDNDKKRLFSDISASIYDEWIWEGGAQALALEARLELGLITKQRYSEIRAKLPADCKDVIKTKRVIDTSAADQTMTWAPYHCGELTQFLVVDLVRRTKPNYSIFDLWKSIFAASPDKQLDNDVFFAAVRKDIPGITDEKIDSIKRLLVTPADGLDAALVQASM